MVGHRTGAGLGGWIQYDVCYLLACVLFRVSAVGLRHLVGPCPPQGRARAGLRAFVGLASSPPRPFALLPFSRRSRLRIAFRPLSPSPFSLLSRPLRQGSNLRRLLCRNLPQHPPPTSFPPARSSPPLALSPAFLQVSFSTPFLPSDSFNARALCYPRSSPRSLPFPRSYGIPCPRARACRPAAWAPSSWSSCRSPGVRIPVPHRPRDRSACPP